jgi:two-component system NtrC family response regulator
LRERIDDLPRLARYLASRFRKIPAEAEIFTRETLTTLSQYDWPGNVRELANVIEHAMILCDELPISAEHLPGRFTDRSSRRPLATIGSPGVRSLREIEMDAIFEALERCGGNKPKAAEELGISLKTLYNKLNQVNSLEKSA